MVEKLIVKHITIIKKIFEKVSELSEQFKTKKEGGLVGARLIDIVWWLEIPNIKCTFCMCVA